MAYCDSNVLKKVGDDVTGKNDDITSEHSSFFKAEIPTHHEDRTCQCRWIHVSTIGRLKLSLSCLHVVSITSAIGPITVFLCQISFQRAFCYSQGD